jgi:putative Ca2+/H+ antiporter (TMEM165/GDT1 family)
MSVEIISAVFGLILLAELGDKTQLVLLTLSAQLSARRVLLGACSAFFLLNLLAVGIGTFFYRLVSVKVIHWVAGGLLVFFGLLVLLRDSSEKEEGDWGTGRPFSKTFFLILLMELGDKTQLGLVALTARYGAPFSVFTGATTALWLSSLLAVFLGSRLARILPPQRIKPISGVIFLVFGLALFMGLA